MTALRTAALAAALALPALAPPQADAQILRRVRERAAEAAGRAVDRAAEAATARVTGTATQAAGQAAGQAAAGALGEAGVPSGGGSGETTDFRALVALFPSSAGGLSRGEASGSRSAAMGVETAEAHADYASGGGASRVTATVTITDTGTMRGLAALGFAWANGMAIDNESSDGFQRSVRIADHPGYLEESRSGGRPRGEASVVVGERFVVKASVDGGGARVAQALVEGVDLGRLAALAGPRVAPVEPSALRAVLPASAGAGARTSGEASTTSAMGVTMAQATATYGTGEGAVTITVSDYAGTAALAAFAWLAGTYDRQSDTGFERTGRIDGHPSVESEARSDGAVSSEAQVVVGRRFLVSATGAVPFATVREALGRVDLGALARLAE